MNRRTFLQAATAIAASSCITPLATASPSSSAALHDRIYKSLKGGMIGVPGTLTEKFAAARSAGFRGVELSSPGVNIDEALRARDATGLFIDGTVNDIGWRVHHSDPDPAKRAQALENLRSAIRETHTLGGNTVLVIPAVVTDPQNENQHQCWDRSIDNIQQAVPLAAELGIYIAFENVWNRFNYDHDGPENQTADLFVDYVDVFNSPWVGMQFDIGNHQKYGKPAAWIRQLGKRIVKLDVKDWGKSHVETGGFCKIGDGDVDWADVCRALEEIGYVGWGAAEVSGGGPDRLAEISANMDHVFQL